MCVCVCSGRVKGHKVTQLRVSIQNIKKMIRSSICPSLCPQEKQKRGDINMCVCFERESARKCASARVRERERGRSRAIERASERERERERVCVWVFVCVIVCVIVCVYKHVYMYILYRCPAEKKLALITAKDMHGISLSKTKRKKEPKPKEQEGN